MGTNLGTVNVVFQADVATAVAGLRSLSSQLDATVASSIARSNQFTSSVAGLSSGVASQIARGGASINNSLGTISGQISLVVDQSTRKTREFSGAFSLLATTVSAFSLKSFVDQVGDYDRQLEAVRVLTRETSEEFQRTRDDVLSLARGLQVSATDVVRGLNDIVQAGFTAADGLRVLEAAIKGARVGLTSTAVSSSALVQVLNAFGIAAGDSESVVGKLVRAVDLGVFSFEKLATNIGQAAPLANTLGISLEELLALFTSLTRKEANLDEVTTQVRAAFSDLIAPSDRARASMEKILGTTVEASIRTRGFSETLRSLIQSADGSASALASIFPNVRALSGLSKLAGEGFAEFTTDIKKLDAASVGSLNRSLGIATKSFGSLVDQIKATAANSLIAYFEKNRASFVSYAEAVSKYLRDNPEFLVSVAKAAVSFAALAVAIGGVKIAVAGLSLVVGVISNVGAAARFAFGGGALTAIATYTNKIDILASKFASYVGIATRTPSVIQSVLDAQAAVASTTASLATASANAAAATNAQAAASARLSAARKAEFVAENELLALKQRQAVADARVQGLALAASSRDPATGKFKTASQGAANLLPSASKDLVQANKAVAASEVALATASTARTSAVAGSVAATRALSVAEAQLVTSTAAATTAANAETVAMGRLTAATGSAANAQAALNAAQGAGAATSVAGATAAFKVGQVVGTTARSFGAAAIGVGILSAKLAGVAAIATGVGFAAYKLGNVIGDYVVRPIEYAVTGLDRFASKSEQASDELLSLVESQKKFYEEANRDAFTKKMAENERAASNFAEKLQNLADLARAAAAGNRDAAIKFASLSKEFQNGGGTSGVSKLVADLKSQYDSLSSSVRKAIDEQVRLGDQGYQGLARIDAKTGEVIATTADLKTLLSGLYGEAKAREIVDDLENVKKQLKDVEAASRAYANATFDLKNNNVSLIQVIKEAQKAVGEYGDKIKKISEDRASAGISGGQKQAKELDDERQQLLDINDILQSRIDLIRQTSIKSTGGVSPEAASAIKDITDRQSDVNKVLAENDKQYTALFNEERQKRVAAEQDAADRIEEAEIDVLRARGDALEADFRAADLYQAKRVRAIEAERAARVKAAREAIGLTDAQRSDIISKINSQADAEIEAVGRVHDAKLNDANDEEIRRQKNTEEGKKAEAEKERARKEAEASAEADDIATKIRQAEINGEVEKRNELMGEYIRKLDEAGRSEEAQLARERERNRTASQRVQLLQDEIKDRLRAGQGAGGVVEAARGAQSSLVGSSDVGSFRGASREKLQEFNSESEAKRFVDEVIKSLRVEYDALEAQRREAINRGDKKTADEIAAKQREVIVKYQALLDEIARRNAEIRGQSQQPQQTTGSGSSTKAQPTPPGSGGTPQTGATPQQSAQSQAASVAAGIPGALSRATDAAIKLAATVEASSRATIAAATTIAIKLESAVKVLNNHTNRMTKLDTDVQKLRIVSVNAASPME